MLNHRDNWRYIKWNSLAMAGLLCHRYPSAMVMVVKPHRMELKTFSQYSQFMCLDVGGSPLHTHDFGAWQRLCDAYREAVAIDDQLPLKSTDDNMRGSGSMVSTGFNMHESVLMEMVPKETGESGNVTEIGQPTDFRNSVPDLPLHLIGFSKGCSVLNQLVYELGALKRRNNPDVDNFISHVKTMTWLDGGHNGGSDTWVTKSEPLCNLAALPIHIYVHVTPYQVRDKMRAWIGREHERFVGILRTATASITDKLHFGDQPSCIENHFKVLENF